MELFYRVPPSNLKSFYACLKSRRCIEIAFSCLNGGSVGWDGLDRMRLIYNGCGWMSRDKDETTFL